MKYKSEISEYFGKFLSALQTENSDYSQSDVSFQIYYDLFRIREAQWRYKLKTNRSVDYSLSDIFQDIIAKYLRIELTKKYSVFLEYKQGKLRPDILIMKDNVPWAIIEVKTTIGWNRGLVKNDDYKKRLNELSEEFKIPLKKTFYVFESSRNVDKDFAEKFISKDESEIKKYILPLYSQTASPYYLSKREKIDGFKSYSDEEILKLYKENKLTDFNEIIKRILEE